MFCHHCGHQLPENSNFCDACGTKLGVNAAATNGKILARVPEYVDDSPSSTSVVMQFIRGIPFGLILLAFFLPLFSVSCSGVNVAKFSGYDLLNIGEQVDGNQLGSFIGESLSLSQMHLLAFMGALMVGFTIMAFLSSYASGSTGGVFGILGLMDLLLIGIILFVKVKSPFVSVHVGSGSIISMVLYIAGIVMGFASPSNEKDLPSGVFVGIGLLGAVGVIVWTIMNFH